MKTLINKYKPSYQLAIMLIGIILSSLLVTSCEKDELDVQQNFPFEVNVMPVPKEVTNGETVEIRITIQRSGNFNSAAYYLRYFQFDGSGILRYDNQLPYQPNDLYSIPNTQFRLYYTSQSTVSQSLDVWISDNFGNEKQLKFQFNSRD